MILRKFIIGVLIRFVLLFGILVALAFIVADWNYLFSQVVLLVILTLLLWEFFGYITKTNRDLSKFIYAIRHQDFSVHFSSYQLGSAFDELHDSFRELMGMYRHNKLDKEEQFQLLQGLVNKMPVGLLVCTQAGEVVLFNAYVAQLIGTSALTRLDRLERFTPGLSQKLGALPLEQPVLLKINDREFQVQRSTLGGNESLHAWILQSTHDASDDQEMDAWLKLIRILTHEIMNSVTSVSSLSATALSMAQNEQASAGIQEALQSIHKRSQGMLSFVADYRKLTNVPAPRKTWFDLAVLVQEQLQAMTASHPEVELTGLHDLNHENIHADRDQIAQVILNILLNAHHAMQDSTKQALHINLSKTGRKTVLHIADSGKGIEPEELHHVFIPFYSTREDGSGIGLSLCRQIMRNHGGSISATSKPGQGAAFSLTFLDGN